MRVLFWFTKDLRVQDNQALSKAAESGEVALCYLAPGDFHELEGIRQHSLTQSLISLQQDLPTAIHYLSTPVELAEYATQLGVNRVIATGLYDTAGRQLQSAVAEQLVARDIALELVGSNYAVLPGTVRKDDGLPLKVYTPFYKRWSMIDPGAPVKLDVSGVSWVKPLRQSSPPKPTKDSPIAVKAGEAFALRTWERFKKRALVDYSENRNRTDLSGTSHLSHALAHGEIHPRTLLAQLGHSAGEEVYRKELAWREFYADVLYHNPHTVDDYFNPVFAKMRYADPIEDAALLEAWKQGRTGYPIVDAAMRQLAQTGWMHNRARMIVASFLVKDLHFEWQIGARHFESLLSDFDPASNSHGWQWTAGCGTDASPYYRVFNPVLQGEKFDPKGDYVRKYVPELRHIPGAAVHQPWLLVDGLANGYPAPIVDHAKERDESLARLKELSN
jgi:deoxyribodipyrimidine photo-lyase